ncbi:keratin-associated protein 13-2-like [Microtus oregoni]|uniref:keratin-associated protein 13-2-like n=1 Tax=Microtus oregoni TaxID=111838 RepID=UPI001BB1E1CC|nr:keratin-associated protein 13-2-like [Microtus oregoni]
MADNCCSRNFSSCGIRHCQPYSGFPCGSSYPSNLVYTTTTCSPSTCQVDSSVNNGCQETCTEPTSCQRSCAVSRPCQTVCYYPRSSTPCSPCWGMCAGSLSFGSSSCCSLGCLSSGLRSLNCGIYGFPSLCYGSGFNYPEYLASTTFQPSSYRSVYGIAF